MTATEFAASPQSATLDLTVQEAASGWESRSSDELRKAIAGGLQGGDAFYGAARELERRAAAMTEVAERDADAERAAQRKRLQLVVAGLAILVAALLAAIFFI